MKFPPFLTAVALFLFLLLPAALQAQTPAVSTPEVEAIIACQAALSKTSSYRAKVESDTMGRKNSSTFEFQAPESYRMSGGPAEIVIIGNQNWMKMGESWMAAPMDMSEVFASFKSDPATLQKMRESITSAKAAGVAMVDGQPTRIYDFATTSKITESPVSSVCKIWISEINGLPLKMTSQSAGKMHGVDFSTESSILYGNFNDPAIRIVKPE